MTIAFDPPDWARRARPANVRATGSDAPPEYSPLPSTPAGSVYTVRGHSAQYGRGRRNGRTVRAIVLHTTESDGFTSSMTFDSYRADTVSAHCYIGESGQIGYTVPEQDRSFTTSRWNDEVLNVEIVGRASWPVDTWLDRPLQMIAITDLLHDWCRRFNIPPRWLTAEQFAEGASRHGATPRQGTQRGIVDHLEANRAAIALGGSRAKYSHHDIGPGLRWIVIGDIIPRVARQLSSPPPVHYPPPNLNPGGPVSQSFVFERPARRILDTRSTGLRPIGTMTPVKCVRGAIGAMVTITVHEPSAAGFITAWPGGAPPNVSCLNFQPGQTVANTTAVELDAEGNFYVLNNGASTHLIVDLIGVYR